MIKLKDILFEFEIGNTLLGDPTNLYKPEKWKELGIPFEPNTDDERKLVHLMQKWITRPDKARKDSQLGEMLKQLLPLKSKFPKILDPSQGRNLYEGKSLYRGTLLPIEDVMNLKGTWQFSTDEFPTGAIKTRASYAWNAAGSSEKGFTSFTPDSSIANNFAASIAGEYGVMQKTRDYDRFVEKMINNEYIGMIPVVIEIPDTYPSALMNPQYTVALSNFLAEFEVFVLGNNIRVSSINIFDWEYYERAFKRANVKPSNYFKGL